MELEDDEPVDQLLFLEELYVARCKDTGEEPTKEEFMHFSSRLKTKVFGSAIILRGTHLGSAAANTLAKFCRNRTDLEKLDLYCNSFKDQGLAVIAHFIQLNQGIRILNIGCNDITDKSQNHLAKMIQSNHLLSLQVGITERPSYPNPISPGPLAIAPEKMISRSASAMKTEILNKPNPTLMNQELNERTLHPNTITAATLQAMSEAIIKSSNFLSLGISSIDFTQKYDYSSPSAESVFIKLLSRSKSLRFLSAANCNLDQDLAMDIINQGFMFNSSLTRLDLSSNWLGSEFGLSFADYLMTPTKRYVKFADPKDKNSKDEIESTNDYSHIFYLDLSSNFFTPDVSLRYADVIAKTQYLGYLDLSDNNIGDEGAIAIANALKKNYTMVELHLSNCMITQAGGIALTQILDKNEILTTLNISRNKLGDETADILAKVLPKNKAITTLNLSTGMITDRGGVAIAEASKFCPTLKTLEMGNNFFTEEVGSQLEKIFKENKYILKINVMGTQVNHFTFHALNEICERNAAFLKKKKKQPIRNTYLQMQYIAAELERKENILDNLIKYNTRMRHEIAEIDDETMKLVEKEIASSSEIERQIVEKEQNFKQATDEHMKMMEELEAKRKELSDEHEKLQSMLRGNEITATEVRDELAKETEIFNKKKAEYDEQLNKMTAEIDALEEATLQLETLLQSPEELAKMRTLPEFLSFADSKPHEKRVKRKESIKTSQNSKTTSTPKTDSDTKGATKGRTPSRVSETRQTPSSKSQRKATPKEDKKKTPPPKKDAETKPKSGKVSKLKKK